MTQKVLITSALPYANGPLHFGHIAGAYLPGDCYARFQRLLKNDVLYICGSDEYGVAITLSAEKVGHTPQQHVDIYHQVIKDFFHKLNLSFDHYSRTTWPGHVKPTQQFFLDLLANGFIEERVTEQLFSVEDNKFLADRYVVGTCPRCGFEEARGDECPKCGASYEATDLKHPRSKLTNAPLTKKATTHWFLLLEKFKDPLHRWLETKNWKPNVVNFVKGYIDELHARSITRDLNWGIPVPLPNAEGKVLYVWFDAPIGYISATMEWAQQQNDPNLWQKYWTDTKTKLVHFIGKDNIPFHAVIFPAMIMGQNIPYKLVDELPANEFYNLEGRQFSKSDGWYIDLDDFFKNYSADQIRYTIAANAPETSDSEFTWKDFQIRCNTELLGKYGNFVNRVLVFAKNNCDSKVPEFNLEQVDEEFLRAAADLAEQAYESYSSFKLRRASQIIMELAQLGNVYFDRRQPWSAAKNPETRVSMETTIACCLECLKLLALVSYPIMPETANKVWKWLGYPSEIGQESWNEILKQRILNGQRLLESQILFRKIENEQIQAESEKLQKMAKKPEVKKEMAFEALKEMIDIEQVRKLDLRVGTVLEASLIPKSKKLLQLKVDLGFEIRTIVAGISQSYRPEDLIGKKVVVVANLKPATLAGVQSEGMVLAALLGEQSSVLDPGTLPNGSIVS